MSWSSEFEPDSNDPTMSGRSMPSPERDTRQRSGPQATQDLARSTLQLATPEQDETDSGPSRALIIGTAILAAIALVAGIFYLSSSDDDEIASPAEESTSQFPSNNSTQTLPLNTLIGGFDTSRIGFEPGSTRFTPEGFDALSDLRLALAADPAATLAFDVRTYTEDNPAKNHQLSIEQADFITEFVLEGDAVDESQISARGLGSAAIDAGDHLSHFVTISLPGASRSIQNSIANTSGFAFATDPGEWPTDIPTSSALEAIVSLVDEEATEVEITISTFDEPASTEGDDVETELDSAGRSEEGTELDAPEPPEDETDPLSPEAELDAAERPEGETDPLSPEAELDNSDTPQPPAEIQPASLPNNMFAFEANANQIGESIEQLLITSGVDPSLVTIVARSEDVQVPSGVNNVVSLVSGEQAKLSQSVEEIGELRFAPGKAELDNASKEALDQAGELLADSPETLIVNVHTFSQQTAEDNLSLSIAQATAATDYLEEQGIPATRLRPVGSGNSNQFDESGRLTLAVLTIAQ